jgi:hypothetical protein
MTNIDKIPKSVEIQKFIEAKFNGMKGLVNSCNANSLLRVVKGTTETLESLSNSGRITTPDYEIYRDRMDQIIDEFSKKCRCYDSDKYIVTMTARTGKITKVGKATIRM